MQQLELKILFHCLQISILLYIILCYEYNEMSNRRNDIRYDIEEDDEIFALTHKYR